MLSIKLFSKSTGRALPMRQVSVDFDVFERGVQGPLRTDGNGEVGFHEAPGLGLIYVVGRRQPAGWLAGRVVLHV